MKLAFVIVLLFLASCAGSSVESTDEYDPEPVATVLDLTCDTCDPTLAEPPFGPVQCDDGNDSTADRCMALLGCAACVFVPLECECDDGNPCTEDACSAGECTHVPVADGTECPGPAVCLSGQCKICTCWPVCDGSECH